MEHTDRLSRKWELYGSGQTCKTLEVIHGDLCQLRESCDVVVCSAFRGDYYPLPGTLIHALLCRQGICVEALSKEPELDLKHMGVWLSRDTGSSYKRVACMELIDLFDSCNKEQNEELLVKKGFSTLRYLIEQAAMCEIPVECIAMPLLGGGCQGIEPEYILGPMITQCRRMLENEDAVRHIVIYERDLDRAQKAIAAFDAAFQTKEHAPEVFISYSTKQADVAQQLFGFLSQHGIPCWMAPLSIPAGSSYLEEIPAAISNMKTMLLVLTPDAEHSRWVQKEVSSAVGSNKAILPYMPQQYAVGTAFSFLLDGEQILPGYLLCRESLDTLYRRVLELNSQGGDGAKKE